MNFFYIARMMAKNIDLDTWISFLLLGIFCYLAYFTHLYIDHIEGPLTETEKTDNSFGVHGWLKVLIIQMRISWPFSILISIYYGLMAAETNNLLLSNMPSWILYKKIEWTLALISLAAWLCSANRLCKTRKKSAVKFAKIILILINFIFPVFTCGIIPFALIDDFEFPSHFITSILASYLGSAICFLYLTRSRRVQKTYFS